MIYIYIIYPIYKITIMYTYIYKYIHTLNMFINASGAQSLPLPHIEDLPEVPWSMYNS